MIAQANSPYPRKIALQYERDWKIFRFNYLIQTGTLHNEVRNDRPEKIERLKIGIVEDKVSDQK